MVAGMLHRERGCLLGRTEADVVSKGDPNGSHSRADTTWTMDTARERMFAAPDRSCQASAGKHREHTVITVHRGPKKAVDTRKNEMHTTLHTIH